MNDRPSPSVERRRLRDDSDVFAARRRVRDLAVAHGVTARAVEELVTAVTEIARNAVVHAGGGELAIELLAAPRAGLVVVVRDAGPGIADVARALEDGFTTGAGLGLGLPSARRMVDELEIESEPGVGTTVTLRKWAG